jgi:methyltransferase-like protein
MEADLGYRVTSLRGESVTLDEFHRQVLRLLDGTRNRAALGEALTAMCRRGELLLHREGPDKAPVRDEAELRELLGPALAKTLENLARKALLRRPAA